MPCGLLLPARRSPHLHFCIAGEVLSWAGRNVQTVFQHSARPMTHGNEVGLTKPPLPTNSAWGKKDGLRTRSLRARGDAVCMFLFQKKREKERKKERKKKKEREREHPEGVNFAPADSPRPIREGEDQWTTARGGGASARTKRASPNPLKKKRKEERERERAPFSHP